MLKAPVVENELNRLWALKAYEILDTLPEALYDNITLLASQICGTPIALVSLIDENRQWFKSKVGLDATHTHRDLSFCGHAIAQRGVFQIPNSRVDPRFMDNPLVVDGPRVIFYAGAPLQTPEGHQIGTLCVIDHEPRTLTEQQTQSLSALADQVVALMEMRLAVRAAKEASLTKSNFLANMSHEIRTPLSAILGFTEILREPAIGPTERVRYLDIIHRNGKELSNLVNDILDLSKVEANQMIVELKTCTLSEVLGGVHEMFREGAERKGVELQIRVSPEVPAQLEMDSSRVRQILTNVVGNAVKFTAQGSVLVEVNHAGEELSFTVTDTGRGISKDQAAHLFRPFIQADPSTAREYGGTGLGLHLTRRLCELMGGSFALLNSELGRGSTFRATVRATLPSELAVDAKGATKDLFKKFQRPGCLAGTKFLVVDDSEDNQILFQYFFEGSGAEISTASNGQEGLEKALREDFDAIFMDIQMPVMDGHEATRRLRQGGCTKPIVALTAHAMREERIKALHSGFSEYLSKPIDLFELGRVLEFLVEPQSGRS